MLSAWTLILIGQHETCAHFWGKPLFPAADRSTMINENCPLTVFWLLVLQCLQVLKLCTAPLTLPRFCVCYGSAVCARVLLVPVSDNGWCNSTSVPWTSGRSWAAASHPVEPSSLLAAKTTLCTLGTRTQVGSTESAASTHSSLY